MKKVQVALLTVFLSGCFGQDMSDLKSFVEEAKAKKPAPIDPLPEFKQAETFLYIPAGRRDPFSPGLEEEDEQEIAVSEGPMPDLTRPKEELESFPLDSLRMVGILDQPDLDVWALIRTQEGTIHRVKVGNYMGQNYGRIIAVSEESVDLIELVPTGRGGYMEREASLDLAGQ